jgi:hypothetical protein
MGAAPSFPQCHRAFTAVPQGARSQRIESLLLHEFHKRKFLLPDKTWGGRDGPKGGAAAGSKGGK